MLAGAELDELDDDFAVRLATPQEAARWTIERAACNSTAKASAQRKAALKAARASMTPDEFAAFELEVAEAVAEQKAEIAAARALLSPEEVAEIESAALARMAEHDEAVAAANAPDWWKGYGLTETEGAEVTAEIAEMRAGVDADRAERTARMEHGDEVAAARMDFWDVLRSSVIADLHNEEIAAIETPADVNSAEADEEAFSAYKREHPSEYAEAWSTTLPEYQKYVADEAAAKEAEHAAAVQERLERLRIDAEARRLHAVELGGFGLFDPHAIADIRDLAPDSTAAALIQGVLGRGQLSMLVGDSYSGKSFLAIDWAAHVATGTPWLGHDTAKGRVLFLAMEGHATLHARLEAWEQHYGQKVDPGQFVVYPRVVNLLDPTSLESLAEYQRREQFDLVIVDTLSRAIGGGDENSSELMGQFIAGLSRLREAYEPSNVLALHHSRKGSPEQYRGASVIFAGMDAVLCLRRAVLGDGETERSDPRRRLIWQKDNAGQLAPVTHLIFEQVGLTGSAVLVQDTTAGVDPVTRHLLGLSGPTTRKELAVSLAAAGLYGSDKSAASRIDKLIREGVLAIDSAHLVTVAGL